MEEERRLFGVLLGTDFYLLQPCSEVRDCGFSVYAALEHDQYFRRNKSFPRTLHGMMGVGTEFHDSGNRNFGSGLRKVIHVHCFI